VIATPKREASTVDRVGSVARRDVSILLSYRFALISRLSRFLFLVVMVYFIAQLVHDQRLGQYSGRYFEFAIVGVVLTRFVELGTTYFVDTISDEQKTGTLEMLLATPTPLPTLLTGALVVPLILMIVESAGILAVGSLFLGAGIDPKGAPLALIVLPLALAVFCAMGIASAAFVILTKRGDPFTVFGSAATMILSGAFFPVGLLPAPVRVLAAVFPPFYALRALRAVLIGGAGFAEIGGELAVLCGFAAVLVPAAVWMFGRAIRIARVTGTLGTY
jgi:ABC-2 type transport system permease protein